MGEHPVSYPYRWTIEEYVLRSALGADIRELVVEGDLDVAFYGDILNRYGVADVNILDADYIQADDRELERRGVRTGVKGRLLALGYALADEMAVRGTLAATVAIVVDRDEDGVPPALNGLVLVTDWYSTENYAFSLAGLDRFVSIVLGRQARPAGAGGQRREDRTPVTGDELLARLEAAAIDLTAVRRVLRRRDPPIGLPDGWPRHAKVEASGHITLSADRLIRAALDARGGAPEDDMAKAVEEREVVSANPRLFVKGRDFVELLLKLLRSQWGKRRSSLAFAHIGQDELGRLVTMSADPVEVDRAAIVASLTSIFR